MQNKISLFYSISIPESTMLYSMYVFKNRIGQSSVCSCVSSSSFLRILDFRQRKDRRICVQSVEEYGRFHRTVVIR